MSGREAWIQEWMSALQEQDKVCEMCNIHVHGLDLDKILMTRGS